jgi:hypothetical protein
MQGRAAGDHRCLSADRPGISDRQGNEQEPDDEDGNCNHRRYYATLIDLVRRGTLDPRKVLTKVEPLQSAIEAYEAFDKREPGWIKVELTPEAAA